ncbi:MAG: 4Fe-4S binding protein [Actinomycetia bacterium]|nr:4Fe-4S binding protein [Actinomycetes bacterium]
MESDIQTNKLISACNPGISDFDSGAMIVLASQCLRSAKLPSDCGLCAEGCPMNAVLHHPIYNRPYMTTDCLNCGFCVAFCPTNALAASKRSIQQINRLLLQATLRVEKLAIGCERSMALLRIQAASSEPEAAEAALALANQARQSENLLVVPCLGMLTTEVWFSALNEIGVSRLQELFVYLPPGQCEDCPVNAKGQVDSLLAASIDKAEGWASQMVTPISEPEQLPQYQRPNIREFFTSDSETSRRDAFTGIFSQLQKAMSEADRVGNRAANEVQKQRARKESLNATRLASRFSEPAGAATQPIVAPLRYLLVEALGRNPAHAEEVSVTVSDTDQSRCTLCGLCVDACPVHARQTVSGEEDPWVEVDPLYCLGCSACLQTCPNQACLFETIDGSSFLVQESLP